MQKCNFDILLNKRKILALFIFCVWIILSLINTLPYNIFSGFVIVFFSIAISLLNVFRSVYKKNSIYFVYFAFILLYAFPPLYSIADGKFLSGYYKYYSYPTLLKTSLIYSLFSLSLFYFIEIPTRVAEEKYFPYTRNDLIFIILIIISVLFILYGKRGENIFNSDAGYGRTKTSTSSLNEYVIILFFIAYIFTGGNKSNLFILFLIVIIYALKNLLFGGRIETLMVLLLFFVIHFNKVLSLKATILLVVIGFYILSIFITIRNNPLQLLSDDWFKLFIPVKRNSNLAYIGTNEGDVFWASQRILLLIEGGYLSLFDRFTSLVLFFCSSVIPYSILPPLANLSNYKTEIFGSGGGGLGPMYIYVYFSYPGVVFLGYFIAKNLNHLFSHNKKEIKYIYAVFLYATLPRWFAYYPIHIIKMCLYGVILYLIIKIINRTMIKYLV